MASSSQILIALVVAAVVAYFGRSLIFGSNEPEADSFTAAMSANSANAGSGSNDRRNIIAKMESNKKSVVVFYGSQTGTAEDLAGKLAKDLSAKFGLKTMTADLEDYDYENLDTFPEDKIAIFMMASYGEGEPTDNAVDFYSFITENTEFSEGETIGNLKFAVFGLGNNTYEEFNKVGRVLDKRLEELGAQRVAAYGEGDDGAGTMEEDFLTWKDELMTTLKSTLNLQERDYIYEPAIAIEEELDTTAEDSAVYLGEPNQKYLEGHIKGPFNPMNPFLAPVKETHELFQSSDRNCVHLEFDLSAGGLRYTTGDHLAFYSQNSSEEVDRMLNALGLTSRRDEVISIKALDSTAQIRIPSPTTYDTVIRYFLEINGPVSRQVLSNLASFAPNEEIKQKVKQLGSDKVAFQEKVSSHFYNLSRLMLELSNGKPWTVPFTFIVENLPHLQARYYSISSSSGEDKNTISITAVVERAKPKGSDHILKGVATNEIFDIMHARAGSGPRTYDLAGPRGAWAKGGEYQVPVSVRHSNFKLPTKADTPIIMVGPGTGVAPFRGFIRERAVQAKSGPVGKALLFFGCRKSTEDALYVDEWPKFTSEESVGNLEGPFESNNFLEVVTAFSRETSAKIYVQHRMKENAKAINSLLEKGAYFYVCGDASHMAREVQNTLADILSSERGISHEEAENLIKKWKARSIYQEDVW